MTEVTPNLPHCGNFCKYCFMGTLLPGKYYFFLLLVPVGSIVIAINEFCSEGKSFFAVITISILILFNVIIFELYVKINKVFAYEKEHTVYAQQFDMIEKITVSQKKMLEEF